MFTIVTKTGCPYCDKAKRLINDNGGEFREVVVTSHEMNDLYKALGYKTYPHIVGIGGYDDLVKFYEENEL